MKTRVKRLLEIPARKHQRESIAKEAPAEKSFLLVVNLWIFRYEYRKEVMPSNAEKEE